MWYFIITAGETGAIAGGIAFPMISVVLLVWVATVGDEWLATEEVVLYPNTASGLLKAVGREEQMAFTVAVDKTTLGFKLVHVTITSHRVLYVLFSMLILGAYMVPKN